MTTTRPVAPASPSGLARGLQLRGLHAARAGREVLHGVDLDVPAGEVTALLGANGAGKSTVVLAIGGLIPVASGQVCLGDDPIEGARPERIRQLGVAVVPEGRRLLGTLSVGENLEVATYGRSKHDAKAGMDYALELFPELKDRMSQTASTLSGGQQQMVVLAQALASRPDVLIVDELSLGLAPVIVRRLAPVLSGVAQSGAAVLLIEQFAHVALSVANTAHVLAGGRIIASAAAEHWQRHPDALSAAYALGSSVAAASTERRTP
jgi:branched-chain amino acid transport system ATP-binding protein